MLFREGERVALSPKVAELLVALVQAEGSELTREQLLQVRPDTVIEQGSLSPHISMLRKAGGCESHWKIGLKDDTLTSHTVIYG